MPHSDLENRRAYRREYMRRRRAAERNGSTAGVTEGARDTDLAAILREQLEMVRRSREGSSATRARAVAYVAGVLARLEAERTEGNDDGGDVLAAWRAEERFDLDRLSGEQIAALQELLSQAQRPADELAMRVEARAALEAR